jgi:hypothetical protein
MSIASYGAVEFDCEAVEDMFPRTIELNEYKNKDGGDAGDRGAGIRETECDIIFFDRPSIAGEGPDSSLDFRSRWHRFFAAYMRGRAQDFVHPTEGGYRAVVHNLRKIEAAGDPDVIRAHCTFVEDSTNPSPLVTGSSRPRSSGLVEAEVALDDADDALGDLEEPPDLDFIADIEGLLGRWREPELALDIASDLNRATRLIETAQRTLTTDPDSYEAFVALERLAANLRLSAEAARQEQPQLRTVIVEVEQPLRTFVAALYGAEEAMRRHDEVMALNPIDDPGLLEAGTELLVPVAEVDRRTVLRSANR